jgi:hypothetical protein
MRADFALDTFDGYLVADADAILLSACSYDCKHALVRTLLTIGARPRCQFSAATGQLFRPTKQVTDPARKGLIV